VSPDKCEQGKCNADGKCEFAPIVCDDKNACTDDSCEKGICKYVPHNCDDGDACTTDSCDAKTGECQNVPKKCDDNNK
jgi:hypothetical protein